MKLKHEGAIEDCIGIYQIGISGVVNKLFNMYTDHSLLDVKLSSMVDRYQCFREMCKKNSCMEKTVTT